MRISVVIPVWQGEHFVGPLLEAISRQSEPVSEILVVETAPTEAVRRLARRFGARYLEVREDEFDHAGTRSWAARRATGEVLLYLTQDVMPVGHDSVRRLVAPLTADARIAAVYGRQVPADEAHPFAAVKRLFNYPDESMTKDIGDIDRLGLRTVFLSNAFAAYRRRALAEVGWFPERQLMCEDITAAARLLDAGYRIHYAADAEVWHTHELDWSREMRRYFDVGAAHSQQPWIRRRFGHPNRDGLRYLALGVRHLTANGHRTRIPEFVARCAFGKLAFTLGSHHRLLSVGWCARLSSFPGWWDRPAGTDVRSSNVRSLEPGTPPVERRLSTLVLLPTYNEAENVADVVGQLLDRYPERLEVAVVDDHSPDGTASVVRMLQVEHPRRLHLIERDGPRGLGRAYRTGFRFALETEAERIVCMDADLSHDPADVRRLVASTDTADLSIGSRYVAGGALRNWPIRRVLLSRWANRYARWITGIPLSDATSGFKCIRREVLERLDLDRIASEGYAFQIELHFLAHRAGYRLREVPITFTDRPMGSSKMNGRVVREAVLIPWRLLVRAVRGRLPLRDDPAETTIGGAKLG